MHGGRGAGNSKARRQVLKGKISEWEGRAIEEVRVKRACCEGGRRQVVPEDSRNV
jgi:hypothetical protein